MKKMKRAMAFALTLVMCLGLFTSCGKSEDTESTKETVASLTGEVKMVANTGIGYDAISCLPSDYVVTETENIDQLKDDILNGDYDFAVLSPIDAAQLYQENGNFKAVTTLSLAEWLIDATNYSSKDTPEITYLSSKKIYGLDDDSATMSEEVLRTLMAKAGKTLKSSQITWKTEEELEELVDTKNIRIMANDATMAKLVEENDGLTQLFNLNSLWQEDFKSDIPGYILIVSDSFLEERGDEVPAVLNDISDNIDKAQKDTVGKLVDYNNSNRGINLIKKFNKVMEQYNINALGGSQLPAEYYYSE